MLFILSSLFHFVRKLVIALLVLIWRFINWIWGAIIIGSIAGVIGNAVYTYVTKRQFDPFHFRSLPIIQFISTHLLGTALAIGFLLILTALSCFTHRYQDVISQRNKIKDASVVNITPAKDLLSKSFNLGDDTAANFPYVVKPIQNVYDETSQALRNASAKTARTKRGILVMGESNAGKTRLAFEILKQTLPSWPVLRWRPDYTINTPIQYVDSNHIVVFIDDLQDYVSPQVSKQISNDLRTITLRTALENLLQSVKYVVVVATCRTEDKLNVQASLNWLFVQLTIVTIPQFSSNNQDPQAKPVIAEFQKQRATDVKEQDWDGTLGSLVLGLDRKNSQYLELSVSHIPASIILKAMKLLIKANTIEHTEGRIRAICTDVFGKNVLLQSDVWQESLDHLITLQFITMDDSGPEKVLVIRKDVYFEKVVTDYLQNQIEQHFKLLEQVLLKLEDIRALSNLSISLSMLKRHEEAMTVCTQAISLNPQSGEVWSTKAFLLLLHNQFEKAVVALDQALSLDPKNISMLINKAFLLLTLSRFEETVVTLDQVVSINPKNPYLWDSRGRIFMSGGHFEEALVAFNQALSLDPKNPYILSHKGNTLGRLNRLEEALIVFDQAISLDSKNPYIWDSKAKMFESCGQCKEALAAYIQAISLDSKNPYIWDNKGRILRRLNLLEEALVAFDQALSLDPTIVSAWYNKGETLERLGRDKGALAAFDHAISLDPNNAYMLFHRGLALKRLGEHKQAARQHKKALVALDKDLAIDSKNATKWLQKGCLLENLGRHKEALTALENAMSFESKNAHAWLDKGKALFALDRHKEALAAFDQALSFYTTDPSAWYHKGITLEKLGRDKEALIAFNQALSLDPIDPLDVWYHKGITLEKLGRDKEALIAFNQALSLDPESVKNLLGRGAILEKLGRDKEALIAFNQALSLDPKNPYISSDKSRVLNRLHRFEESLVVIDQALSIDPKNADILYCKCNQLALLGRIEESLDVIDRIPDIKLNKALLYFKKHKDLVEIDSFTKFGFIYSFLSSFKYKRPVRIISLFISRSFKTISSLVSRLIDAVRDTIKHTSYLVLLC